MTARTVHVLRPGLQTTVQDLGRWGHQALGVSVAGPMDPFSHRLANALVGNRRNAAALEITLIGPELEFEGDCIVAVAGAEFEMSVDSATVPHGRSLKLLSGAKLQFGRRLRGARAYLAVDGGFDVPVVLGSRSTHVPSRIGGLEGRSLRKGDRLRIDALHRPPHIADRTSAHTDDMLIDPAVVRVASGPEADHFAADALEMLQSSAYTVEAESDRMGFRLRGPELRHSSGPDIISEATPAGCLQVPGSGQPILLMADRQTTGGYARIATVISADIGIAGQQAPGDRLSFKVCSAADALTALIAREHALLTLEGARR